MEENDELCEVTYPLMVLYCPKCSVPAEYCSYVQKDLTACKEWLKEASPLVFSELYGDAEDDGQIEEKKGGGGGPKKVKKVVKFGKEVSEGQVTVYKLKRGKKTNSLVSGLEHYTKDLASCAKKFGKRFACGSSVTQDEIYGECVLIQGDVEHELQDFLKLDATLAKLNIPSEKVVFEERGNFKGRKR